MITENWLIITLGGMFATLTEFIDQWRYKESEKKGPITRIFAFSTDFDYYAGKDNLTHITFGSAVQALKQALAEDANDSHKPVNYDVKVDPEDISKLTKNCIAIFKLKDGESNLKDIKNEKQAKAATTMIMEKVQEISDFRNKQNDIRLLFCLAGGRKTMSADLSYSALFFRQEQDKIFHLLVDPEFNNNSFHLHHDKGSKDAYLVDYNLPRLTGMYSEFTQKKIITSVDMLADIINPVTEAMASNTAQAFAHLNLITDPELRNDYIQLVARWISSQNQERLWGGDIYGYFVDHGFLHACRVIKFAGELLNLLPENNQLTPEEIFVLFCSCWLHDIGMSGDDNERSFKEVRKQHGIISQRLILNSPDHYSKLFDNKSFKSFRRVIAETVSYHQKNRPLNEAQQKKMNPNGEHIEQTMKADNKTIRTRLLAAILQLADACDVTADRTIITADEKKARNLLLMETKAMQIIDSISYLLLRTNPDSYESFADELEGVNNELANPSVKSANKAGRAMFILNNIARWKKDLPDSCKSEADRQKAIRLDDLIEELELMANQYQNHYLLHQNCLEVKPTNTSLKIVTDKGANKTSNEDRIFYHRQIQKTIGEDLFLTFEILNSYGLKIRMIDTDDGLKMPRNARFTKNLENMAKIDGYPDFTLDKKKITTIGYEDHYLDTEDHQLLNNGITLRLRKESMKKWPDKHTIKIKNTKKSIQTEILLSEQEFKEACENEKIDAFIDYYELNYPEIQTITKPLQVTRLHTARELKPLVYRNSDLRESKVLLCVDNTTYGNGHSFKQLEIQEVFVEEAAFNSLRGFIVKTLGCAEEVDAKGKYETVIGKLQHN